MNVIKNAFDQNDTPYDRDPSKNTFAQFLLNGGLYEKFEITRTNIQDLIDVLNGNVRINLFCKDCGENRIFSMKEMLFPFIDSEGFQAMRGLGKEISGYQRVQELCATPQPGEQCVENKWDWTNWQMWDYTRVMVFQYRCALNDNHFADFVVRANGNTLVKIGQYPSVADLTFPELKEVFMMSTKNKLAAAVIKGDVKGIAKKIDPNEVGGTAFLGISKPVIKAHGSSGDEAFFAAIRQAMAFAEADIVSDIENNIDYMKISEEA